MSGSSAEVGREGLGVVGLPAEIDLAQGVVARTPRMIRLRLVRGGTPAAARLPSVRRSRASRCEGLADPGLDHLDDDGVAFARGGPVDLRNRGGTERDVDPPRRTSRRPAGRDPASTSC